MRISASDSSLNNASTRRGVTTTVYTWQVVRVLKTNTIHPPRFVTLWKHHVCKYARESIYYYLSQAVMKLDTRVRTGIAGTCRLGFALAQIFPFSNACMILAYSFEKLAANSQTV